MSLPSYGTASKAWHHSTLILFSNPDAIWPVRIFWPYWSSNGKEGCGAWLCGCLVADMDWGGRFKSYQHRDRGNPWRGKWKMWMSNVTLPVMEMLWDAKELLCLCLRPWTVLAFVAGRVCMSIVSFRWLPSDVSYDIDGDILLSQMHTPYGSSCSSLRPEIYSL